MSSWRSRFRRNNKTPDSHDTKTSILSKNLDDVDSQKKRRSRFLRRSKHEDDCKDRPQSMFIEKSAPMVGLAASSAIYNPPTVQEILDKNRHVRRSNSKSPKTWRRLISGERPERSPSTGRRSEDIEDNDSHSYLQKSRDANSNSYVSERKISNSGSDSLKGSTNGETHGRTGSSLNSSVLGSADQRKREDYDSGIKENSAGRRISHIRRQKSIQNEEANNSNENDRGVRSGSPYDNVIESGGTPRRERRPRSHYFEEEKSELESGKSMTPRRERRQKTITAETQVSEMSHQKSEKTSVTKKDSFVLRKPRAKYPTDDGDDNIVSSEKASNKSKDVKQKESVFRPISPREDVERTFAQRGYSQRSSENILGATLNYLEKKSTSNLSPVISNNNTGDAAEDTPDFLERRRRYQNLMGDNRSASRTRLQNAARKSVDYADTERRSSYVPVARQSTITEQSATRRESYGGRIRPKSLYSNNEPLDFSGNLSKFKQLSKDESSDNARQSNSAWDKYKTRNDDKCRQIYSGRKDSLPVTENEHVRRPKSLFLSDAENSESSAYRGSWSAVVPKKPAHLKDFSKPDENTPSRISYRRRESQQLSPRVDESEEASKEVKEETQKAFLARTELETQNDSPWQQPAKMEAVPEIAIEDTTKEEEDSTVVRRRRREHAPAARPSSAYHVKKEAEKSDDIANASFESKPSPVDLDKDEQPKTRVRPRRHLLDSEDIKTGLRNKSAVERRIRNKQVVERPKSVHLGDVFGRSASNLRHSDYLQNVKLPDPLSDSVNDVKREFEKLLRRTENWKLRTETLDSKANVLTSSYRNLRRTISGIRDESDDVYAVFDDIGTRLTENDTIGFPNTEDDWRRAMEGNKLITKATSLLLEQQTDPKPDFYYSESESEPDSPVSSFYGMPRGNRWSSSQSHASRKRPSSDYLSLRSSENSSAGASRSHSSTTLNRYDYTTSTTTAYSTKLSPLMSDIYSRRPRYQDSLYEYKRDSIGLRSSPGRKIPETAV